MLLTKPQNPQYHIRWLNTSTIVSQRFPIEQTSSSPTHTSSSQDHNHQEHSRDTLLLRARNKESQCSISLTTIKLGRPRCREDENDDGLWKMKLQIEPVAQHFVMAMKEGLSHSFSLSLVLLLEFSSLSFTYDIFLNPPHNHYSAATVREEIFFCSSNFFFSHFFFPKTSRKL